MITEPQWNLLTIMKHLSEILGKQYFSDNLKLADLTDVYDIYKKWSGFNTKL